MKAMNPDASVGPLERGLTVLRSVAQAPSGKRRPSDLVRLTGLARSTVDRIATTLVRLGYLRTEGDRDLVPAPRLLEFGLAYLHANRIPQALGPLAERLADQLDESVSLAVPDADAVRFVVQTPRRRALSVTFRAGDALPAESCAPGALFAAEWEEPQFARWRARIRSDPDDTAFPALPPTPGRPRPTETEFRARAARARRYGWSEDDQLVEPGLVAVAVPVRDEHGRVVCALSVASHTSRHSAASLREHALTPLLRTAELMGQALAQPQPQSQDQRPAALPERDSSPDLKRELGPEYLQSLARGLAVLAALDAPGGMRLTALAEATALPRATARRALLTLEQLGYVVSDGSLFSPLPRVLDLGYAPLSALTLPELAQPHLVDLVHRVHESASVAVLDGPDIRYIARVAARRIMRVDISIGTRFPAYATSMGRVLLSGLPVAERAAQLARTELVPLTEHTITDPAGLEALLAQVRRDGFAVVEQELEEGLRSIAVPVRMPDGRVVAAVNVSLHAGRVPLRETPDLLLPALQQTARLIAQDLALVL